MPKSSLRILDVLELLAEEKKPIGHAAIASRLKIPKSSLTGLLGDLLEKRYLVLDAGSRGYSLGPRVLMLSKGYLEPMSLVRIGRPVLTDIVLKINESCSIAVRDGLEMLVVAQESCRHPLAHTMIVGSRSPLHCTASGKILLAYADDAERERILSELTLPRMARNTITCRERLREDLQRVAKTGLAISDEEAIDGVYALAAPVLAEGRIVAALSTAIPTSRLAGTLKDEAGIAVRASASGLGMALGG